MVVWVLLLPHKPWMMMGCHFGVASAQFVVWRPPETNCGAMDAIWARYATNSEATIDGWQ